MKQSVLVLLVLLVPVACSRADMASPQAETAPAVHAPELANLRHPEASVYTSGRLQASDIPALREAGVRHVIDLSLDSETPGFDEAGAMRDAAIAYDALPIAGAADLTRDNVAAFDALLRESRGPVLVHCASGNRVGAMAALRAAWIEGQPAEAAIAEGRAWGLRSLEPQVRALLQAPAP